MYSKLFKSLIGFQVIVEMKNNCIMKGRLQYFDENSNVKLSETEILNQEDFPHIGFVPSAFIRGSTIRYIHLPPDEVDLKILVNECREYHKSLKSGGDHAANPRE